MTNVFSIKKNFILEKKDRLEACGLSNNRLPFYGSEEDILRVK